jgi:hypothetical protein
MSSDHKSGGGDPLNGADMLIDEDECVSAMDVDFDDFLRRLDGEVRPQA